MSLAAFVTRIEDAARIGGASELDLATLRQLVLNRREFETMEQAARVGELERVLSTMEPAERREAICQRLGFSRRRYYQLRELSGVAAECTGSR